MTDEEKAEKMGFEVSESDGECEQCGAEGFQLWYSGGEDGVYMCLGCIVALYDDNESIMRAIEQKKKEGHPYHCAARQIFGDGECECDLYNLGYDPYAWHKRNLIK
jgi:hypothetical protein